MSKGIIIFLLLSCLVAPVWGQSKEEYTDELLSRSFQVFQSADVELAYHILPFLRERFIQELDDSSSFSNPFDSLSNFIDIRLTPDSLLKTYCWSERNGACCHTSATFAQFRTNSGHVNLVDLEELEEGVEEVFITGLHQLEIQKKTHYLVLGWGTCCGGKHYSTARVYEVLNDSLVKSGSVFNDESEIYAGANRSQKIEMVYSAESGILSYYSYKFNEDTGFYTEDQSLVQWKLTRNGFKKLK